MASDLTDKIREKVIDDLDKNWKYESLETLEERYQFVDDYINALTNLELIWLIERGLKHVN